MKTKEEIQILQADALSGDSGAQNDLGCAYSSGDGVDKDLKEAFIWFERSAKQGNKYGQYNLGWYYHFGLGTTKNIQSAIEWYEKSANQGFGKAANMLGVIYKTGYKPTPTDDILKRDISSSLEANPKEAFYWFCCAAKYSTQGLLNLGSCYETGLGTIKNSRKACYYYHRCITAKNEQNSILLKNATEGLNRILQNYCPAIDTRISAVDVFKNNPFRILGLFSNSSEKEIRAHQSKIQALLRIGKNVSFDVDRFLPSTFEEYRLLYHEIFIRLNLTKYITVDVANTKYKEFLEKEFDKAKITYPDWKEYPERTLDSISESINKLSSNTQRIKYAFFWFCNANEDDNKALNLISQHNWEEALDIWDNTETFSSHINIAMFYWIFRNDIKGVEHIMELIHNEEYRNSFISHICPDKIKITETELAHLFWDTLYEFPHTEIIPYELCVKVREQKQEEHFSEITEDDVEYNEQKVFELLKSPLEDAIIKAEKTDRKDFEGSLKAYKKIIQPYVLLEIQRLLGEENKRYIYLCNDIASKLLEFAIYYNNENKLDWGAPSSALYLANFANKIAINEALKERCKDNVDIFSNNKQIATSDEIIKSIRSKIEEIDEIKISFTQVEKLLKELELRIECLKTENGDDAEICKRVSDDVVNVILNLIITICNRNKDATTAAKASSLLDKMKTMEMSSGTKMRLQKNYSIISNNMMAAIGQGNYDNLGGDNSKANNQNRNNTYIETKEQKQSRSKHKAFTSIIAVLALSLIGYFLSLNNNWEHIMSTMGWVGYSIVVFKTLVVAFLIIMWGMEFQKNPYDTNMDWLDNLIDVFKAISDKILKMGVQGRKTYSWPFALPFELIFLILFVLSFPIRWLAKLAALIK